MKITAHGKNRAVYTHTVADVEIKQAATGKGKVHFQINSKNNPGIGTGQYVLYFELEKTEVDRLSEASMRIVTDARISELEDELKGLKRELAKLAA